MPPSRKADDAAAQDDASTAEGPVGSSEPLPEAAGANGPAGPLADDAAATEGPTGPSADGPARPPLALGSIGPDVLLLQHRLGVAGTGKFDAATENAVKATQLAANVEPTGVVDDATRAILEDV